MKNLSKNLIYGILILMSIALLGSLVSETVNQPEVISLSELVQKINEDKVAN